MENASIENASTKMHGWNTQVRKTQVKICRGGKRKYGNGKSDLDADTMLPDFVPVQVMADFEDASMLAFREVFGQNVEVEGCWFHFAQLGASCRTKSEKNWIIFSVQRRCGSKYSLRITCLPLLPPNDIDSALTDLETFLSVSSDSNKPLLRRLLDYARRSWLMKASVGPARLSVSGRIQRTNNGVESFHNVFRQLVKVSHPSFLCFFGIYAGSYPVQHG